ncbi:MAG TPA: hypothetical protein PLY04_10590 [bacterium]|nr:hypothetical protein [bacterium]HPM98033.1 hypothetical protein [bacterium]
MPKLSVITRNKPEEAILLNCKRPGKHGPFATGTGEVHGCGSEAGTNNCYEFVTS